MNVGSVTPLSWNDQICRSTGKIIDPRKKEEKIIEVTFMHIVCY